MFLGRVATVCRGRAPKLSASGKAQYITALDNDLRGDSRTYACATSTRPKAVIVLDSQVIFGFDWRSRVEFWALI